MWIATWAVLFERGVFSSHCVPKIKSRVRQGLSYINLNYFLPTAPTMDMFITSRSLRAKGMT